MEDCKTISYLAYESATARLERTNRRVWILCLVLIIALVSSNLAWLWWENQWEEVSVTQEIEATADGNSDLRLNTVGGDYCVSESQSQTDN